MLTHLRSPMSLFHRAAAEWPVWNAHKVPEERQQQLEHLQQRTAQHSTAQRNKAMQRIDVDTQAQHKRRWPLWRLGSGFKHQTLSLSPKP
jgi:hypothetical protein